MQFTQIGPGFAAEVTGLDISIPLSRETIASITAAMDEHAILVFHGQNLTNDRQLAFTELLGPLESVVATSLRSADDNRLPPTFADVSNLDKNNQPFALDDRRRLFAIGNRLWHSDSSFKVVPARYSLLYSRSVPSKGGNTEFANMRMAYDDLDVETKDLIENLVCEHSQIFSRQKPEARALLLDLTEHATQAAYTYSHKWQVGDLVMWDNQQTMHRSRPYPHSEPRDMRRTTIAGNAPTVEQRAA